MVDKDTKIKIQKNWIKIYPIYLDKNFKYSEGRKTSVLSSVDNPTIEEIFKICSVNFKLNCKAEPKHHPKDYLKRGRVVVYFKEEGKSIHKDIKSKNTLLKEVSKLLSELREKGGNNKIDEDDHQDKKRRRKKK